MKPFDPATMEASCPECGSTDFDIRAYDFGMDQETGYRDAGERATCLDCGFSGELRGDFERLKRKVTCMTNKEAMLKPRLIECVNRLQKLIELDAPSVIIGNAAFSVFSTTLAVYGESAGSTFIQHLRDQDLHGRGVCSHEDCTSYVDRPDIGVCASCLDALGIDDDASFLEGADQETA
jgi:hypothetical protein